MKFHSESAKKVNFTLKFNPYVIFGIFSLMMLLVASFWLPLLSYQEAKRAVIIQETYLSKTLFPKFNEVPYFTKPPLHTWLSLPFYAIGSLFNQEIFALRLLSFLAIGLLLYLLYLFSQRKLSKTLLSVFVLLSSFRFLSFIYRIDLEPLFIFFVFLSIYVFIKYVEKPSLKTSLLFYALFGLAFMVRGPLHFFLIPSILAYGLITKKPNFIKILFQPLGWFLFLIIVLPFYLYGYLKFGPSIFEEFFKVDLSERLYSQKDPFYYYFLALSLNFFPYLLLLLIKIKTLKKDFSLFKDYPSNFFLFLTLFSVFLLSFTGEKFDKYLLFLYPFFALFLSEILLKLYSEKFLINLSALFYSLNFLAVLLILISHTHNLRPEIELWKKELSPKKEYFFYKKVQPLALFIIKHPIPVVKDLKELSNNKSGVLISPEILNLGHPTTVLKDPYKRGELWYIYPLVN
jgi:4-amino-4-deoxy-L-arabinose transferase-like glycosyltransferase